MVNSYHQFENVSPDALPYGNSPNRGLHLNWKIKIKEINALHVCCKCDVMRQEINHYN